MLSQVERGETSPTLAVASRIAAGLELRLSQLLRLDEDGTRLGRPRAPSAAAAAARPATASRSSPRRCPASAPSSAATCWPPARRTGGPGDPPMHEPGSREIALVERGTVVLHIDGADHELHEGDTVTFDADLPHHFENPGPGGGRACWPSSPPGCAAV